MTEYRFAELRADGRTLEGVAVRYGDEAQITPSVRERFEAGSITPVADGVILNVQHDRRRPLARTGDGGGLELLDSSDALKVRAALPPTREADDTLALVKRGVLRGLSVEFDIIRERWEGTLRIVERALLAGIGVVDRPAYPQSAVHARQDATGARISGSLTYGAPLVVGTPDGARQAATKEVWAPHAFEYAVKDGSREINLILGDYNQPLASKMAGTLTLTDLDSGLIFDAPVPDTSWARDMLRSQAAGAAVYRGMPRFRVPPIDGAVTYETEPGTGSVIRRVNEAVLSAIVISTRAPRAAPPDDPEGDPVYGGAGTLTFEDGERGDQMITPASRRRKAMVI